MTIKIKDDADRRTELEAVSQNRQDLAAQYVDLLQVAEGDKAKLINGIRNLGGINESNEEVFAGLTIEEIVERITLTINDLDPTLKYQVEYSHGQTSPEATHSVSVASTKVTARANQAIQIASIVETPEPQDHATTDDVATETTSLEEKEILNRVKGGEVSALHELVSKCGYELRRFPDEMSPIVAVWKGEGPTYLFPHGNDKKDNTTIIRTSTVEHIAHGLFDLESRDRILTCTQPAVCESAIDFDNWMIQHDQAAYFAKIGIKKGKLSKLEDS